MRLHLRFHRKSEFVQEALQKDGWQLQREADDSVSARHPLVCNETAARNRLQDLGLLTTRAVSIEFLN
jgi:hypothetical protein